MTTGRTLWKVEDGHVRPCSVQEGIETDFVDTFLHLSSAWRQLSSTFVFRWHLDEVNEIEPCFDRSCRRDVHADTPRGIVECHRANFLHAGPWRPLVQSGRSLREIEFQECLKRVARPVVTHDRSLIAPYELDAVLYKNRLAFEFNGDYWHSDERLTERSGLKAWQYHRSKVESCENLGFRLAFVWESTWRQSRAAVMDAVCDFIQFRRDSRLLTAETSAPNPFLVTCEENDFEGENVRRLHVQSRRFRQFRKVGVR